MKLINSIIRILLFLFGAVGFTGFFVPVLRRRILNAGNSAGIVICLGIIIYAIFMPKIHEIIRIFWQKTIGKIVLTIMAVGLISAVVCVVVITSLMIKAAVSKPVPNATVIVLGCKVNGKSPSIMLAARLDAALEYLNLNTESSCIVSGGQGDDEMISEAECMYNYLTEHGISPERIFMEDKSTTTRENLKFSYEIIKEHDLNENIAIATNNFHEYRASLIAREMGLESGALSGSTLPWLLPTYYARELLAIMYESVL